MSTETVPSIVEEDEPIAFPPKQPIPCIKFIRKNATRQSPGLIFTHGAGGTLRSNAVINFANGFAQISPIICFKGNMNLKSRTKMFTAVHEDQQAPQHLGGRSMGARAAVMAATDQTTHLVLVSYPLHTDKETRDQILLDLPAAMKVIFVSGDGDNMCDLQRLRNVRQKIKCKSWLVVVEGADHGMNVKPKAGAELVGRKTGHVVAEWLGSCDENATESRICWNVEDETVQWSGWLNDPSISLKTTDTGFTQAQRGTKRKRVPEKSGSKEDTSNIAKPAKGRKRK